MRRTARITTALATATLLAATAACSGTEEAADDGATDTTTEETTEAEPMGDAVLATTDSELGTIVVDGEGMTVYYFTPDEPGSGVSVCEDECLINWPPVHAQDEDPQVDGVTAEVGTITGNDGELQVTLDGRPVYLFVGDEAPGDVAGQAVEDVWWVVAPDGAEITETAGAGSGY
ncbi:COG4315 family predicted lipoprotein [Isoptericola croceus]|uniref:COG4315 family predicted lipoprotein n=1 Tax=Isoptericola croceus TaxID=3031406 RepID=UPI0023F9F375|nr:hypothetical protein [Isoptericola croceus]